MMLLIKRLMWIKNLHIDQEKELNYITLLKINLDKGIAGHEVW